VAAGGEDERPYRLDPGPLRDGVAAGGGLRAAAGPVAARAGRAGVGAWHWRPRTHLASAVVTSFGVTGLVESYQDLAGRILHRPARLGSTRLVAADGPSGAGKTVFAARLADALTAAGPDGTEVVHTDDLLDGWADQFTFWPRLEEWVLAPLRAGRPGRYRRYDWARRQFTEQWTAVPPAPVLILEGVSTARAVIRPELAFAVFVTAPSAVRLDRSLARDGAAMQPYLDEWRRAEQAHFDADGTRDHVDLVVDGAPEERHDPSVGYVRLT